MKVLGVDPGLSMFGYALVCLRSGGEDILELGVIETKKSSNKRRVLASDDNLRRAREIVLGIRTVCGSDVPKVICAESMSFPRNASSSAKIGMAWGVLAAISEFGQVPVVQASPQEVKKVVCGNKAASKVEVETALVLRYGEGTGIHSFRRRFAKGKHEHGFDALAAVVACLDSEVLRMARGMAK